MQVAALATATAAPGSSTAYVSPKETGQPDFPLLKAGDRHLYGFTVTKDFADANAAFLRGDAGQALSILDRILADPAQPERLLLQVSTMRALSLMMSGRSDAAESELIRMEQIEIRLTKTNIFTRAVRAHIRLSGGDTDGAIADAGQVLQKIGNWRFPTTYTTPPSDQDALIQTTGAQSNAQVVMAWALMSKGSASEAAKFADAADQTMNDILHLKYRSIYGKYMPSTPETFLGRGMSSTVLGAALAIAQPGSPEADEKFSRAIENFEFVGFRPGPGSWYR